MLRDGTAVSVAEIDVLHVGNGFDCAFFVELAEISLVDFKMVVEIQVVHLVLRLKLLASFVDNRRFSFIGKALFRT